MRISTAHSRPCLRLRFRRGPTVLVLVVSLLLLLLRPRAALCGEESRSEGASGWTPYQFALWNPVQLFDESKDVYGLRTSIFYGKNRDIYGLDVSLFANNARNVTGVSLLGLGNEFYYGFLPSMEYGHSDPSHTGDVTGVQIGGGAVGWIGIIWPVPLGPWVAVTTRARDLTGLQVSLIGNRARRLSGVQLAGFFGHADETAHGLQVGVWGNRAGAGGAGFQLGLVQNETKSDYHGVQMGLLGENRVRGDKSGVQVHALGWNRIGADSTGLQMGLGWNDIEDRSAGAQIGGVLNKAGDECAGLQLGAFNVTMGGREGVQIGLINYSRRMSGIQIGGINIIPEGPLPFFIGLNASVSF